MVQGKYAKHFKLFLALLLICIAVATGMRMAYAQDAAMREMQQLLAEQGYDPGPIDGFMGPRTASALKAYQEANGLAATGIPDSETTNLLRHPLTASPQSEQHTTPSPSQTSPSKEVIEDQPTSAPISVEKEQVSGGASQKDSSPDLPLTLPSVEPAQATGEVKKNIPSAETFVRQTLGRPAEQRSPAPSEVPEKSSPFTGMNVWWWGVGFVGILVWFILSRKKKKELQTPSENSGLHLPLSAPTPTQSETVKRAQPPVLQVSEPAQQEKRHAGQYGFSSLGSAPRSNTTPRWVPYGQSVDVAGRNIGGFVYVGSPPRIGQYQQKCRAYIDPTLSVAKSGTDLEGNGMGYWPSYSEISASSRATYLEWLRTGRKDTAYNPGYLFLYFYGLERRFFEDLSGEEEKRRIYAEVRRLKALYSNNYSVQKYLGGFLDFASTVIGETGVESHSSRRYEYELPFSVKALIGCRLEDNQSLDSDVMLRWWRLHPESQVRTVVRRCPEEFQALFRVKFVDRFPTGLIVNKPKRMLKGTYEAASSEFKTKITPTIGGKELPDISGLRKPVTIAQEIADEAMSELDKFSRYLSRKPEGRGSLEAHALLPKKIWNLFPSDELNALSDWAHAILSDTGLVPLVDVILSLGGAIPEKVGKRQLTDAADALARLGIGMAPDPRYSLRNPKVGDPVVLFKLPGDDTHLEDVTDRYRAALIQLAVGTFVAHADGTVVPSEEAALKNAIVDQADLTAAEQARLLANLKWLLVVPPDMSLLRSKLKAVTPEQQRAIRDFAVTMAHADSLLRPEEVGGIEKIYKALGVETTDVYSDIHSTAFRDEPVTVRAEQTARNGESLPVEETSPLKLDAQRIAAIQSDTASVSSVLGSIFGNELPDEDDEVEAIHISDARFTGLSAGHTAFLSDLILQDHWTDEEFEELAGRHKLMVAGCLETINEWAYAKFDDALIEEYDGYELNIDVVQEFRESV